MNTSYKLERRGHTISLSHVALHMRYIYTCLTILASTLQRVAPFISYHPSLYSRIMSLTLHGTPDTGQ